MPQAEFQEPSEDQNPREELIRSAKEKTHAEGFEKELCEAAATLLSVNDKIVDLIDSHEGSRGAEDLYTQKMAITKELGWLDSRVVDSMDQWLELEQGMDTFYSRLHNLLDVKTASEEDLAAELFYRDKVVRYVLQNQGLHFNLEEPTQDEQKLQEAFKTFESSLEVADRKISKLIAEEANPIQSEIARSIAVAEARMLATSPEKFTEAQTELAGDLYLRNAAVQALYNGLRSQKSATPEEVATQLIQARPYLKEELAELRAELQPQEVGDISVTETANLTKIYRGWYGYNPALATSMGLTIPDKAPTEEDIEFYREVVIRSILLAGKFNYVSDSISEDEIMATRALTAFTGYMGNTNASFQK